MPVKKTLPYKVLVRNLLASKKLTKPEQAAFEKMAKAVSEGTDLDRHQKLWIETLNDKYLVKR
jgi:hypothetical protein